MPRSLLRVGILALAFVSLSAMSAYSGQTVDMITNVTGVVFGNSFNVSPGAGGNSPDMSPAGNTVNNNGWGSSSIVTGGQFINSADIVSENSVNITGTASFESVRGGRSESGDASLNQVTIVDGSVKEMLGGFSDSGNSINNTVTIHGGTFGGSFLSYAAAGGYSSSGNSNGNTVIINGGTFNGYVFGGRTDTGATANGNTLIINGGRFYDYVFAGNAATSGNEASGNTVTISGTPDLTGAYLAGGFAVGGTSANNTLNLHSNGITLGSIGYFQNLNFYVPASLSNGGTMLSVTGYEANITGATVNVGIDGGSSPLSAGDTVVLIDASSATRGLVGTPVNTTADGQGMQGVTLQYASIFL